MLTNEQAAIDKAREELAIIETWQRDVFLFVDEALGMKPAEPIDSLRGVPIEFTDAAGNKRSVMLFDNDGRLVYDDLAFYRIGFFKNQGKEEFKAYNGTRLTWQQTLTFTAYQRAISTFDQDAYAAFLRYISIVSGHGTGKTASLAIIALHFLITMPGAQVGATANTEDQLKEIFLKELYFWRKRLPQKLQDDLDLQDDFVRVSGEKDWFLRARVARADKPEALAGLHGPYVLLIIDEASGVPNRIFEVMDGSLTGENFIVLMASNGTRTEGVFFDSHKEGAPYNKLAYNCEQSPIVKDGYVAMMAEKHGKESDEYAIRVKGGFAATTQMDEKGWIPLFANIRIMFEPERGQIVKHPVIGLDPAGKGRDLSILVARDSVYLKILLNEKTSTAKDLARKVETWRDALQAKSDDIGVDAFGIGAEVVANIQTKVGETVHALLTDKPREGTEQEFHSYKAELAWKFRAWVLQGGIIITNRQSEWMKELEKIKYKRDLQGRIQLMDKVTFKKLYGFSPDRFDAALYTFFRDFGTQPVVLTKRELENKSNMEWIQKMNQQKQSTAPKGWDKSSM